MPFFAAGLTVRFSAAGCDELFMAAGIDVRALSFPSNLACLISCESGGRDTVMFFASFRSAGCTFLLNRFSRRMSGVI